MLIKVIDHRGKETWVNPSFIRGLVDKGGTRTKIDISGQVGVVVDQPMDEVAGLVNLALQECGPLGPAQLAEAQAAGQSQSDAAMIAAIVIGG